jgi:pSer/pThr/pTyr-binding forkhead associated (FHA) protein
VSHVYCPACGFQNPETSNYCSKCGSLLVIEDVGDQTQTLLLEDVEREAGGATTRILGGGPALVVRSGGGRTGESFRLGSGNTTIGRSPDCDVFLDDVTVSRRHAQIIGDSATQFRIDDQGSLNGTYVNRRRIDSQRLEDGDEIQIGKYRLIFLSR